MHTDDPVWTASNRYWICVEGKNQRGNGRLATTTTTKPEGGSLGENEMFSQYANHD
jgi:hypothetical protein